MSRTTLPQEIGSRIEVSVSYKDLMTYLCRHGFWPERIDGVRTTMYRQFPDFYLRVEVEPEWRDSWRDVIAAATH